MVAPKYNLQLLQPGESLHVTILQWRGETTIRSAVAHHAQRHGSTFTARFATSYAKGYAPHADKYQPRHYIITRESTP